MGLKKFLSALFENALVVFAVGLFAGAIIILAIRFFTYKTPSVHYHANFAIYINGQQEQFKAPVYYEEEAGSTSCAVETKMTPEERVHMHDNVNNLVHVHDNAVTWGNFFSNLGWVVDPQLIQTRTAVYMTDSNHKISFILNGQAVDNIMNRVIGDQDRLLVDYGNGNSKTLNQEFKTVASTAKAEDQSQDPASCGGSAPTTTSQRWHHLF